MLSEKCLKAVKVALWPQECKNYGGIFKDGSDSLMNTENISHYRNYYKIKDGE